MSDLKKLANPISISENDIKNFKKEGVIVLRNLISPEAIDKIRQVFNEVAIPTPLGFTGRYKRICYNLEDYSDIFDQITASEALGKITQQLTGKQLILSQAVGMESEPNPEVAVKWHYDQVSYSFVSTNTPVFGLWFPLVRISKSAQRGGIVYVPRDVVDLTEKLTQWEEYYLELYKQKIEGGKKYEELNSKFNYSKVNGLDWLSEDDFNTLDNHAIEHDFDIGDALLMDRNVYHKTAPLLQGAIQERLVCNVRFFDATARLNRKLFEGFNIHARIEKRILPRAFISKLIDLADGDKITSSKYCRKPFPIK